MKSVEGILILQKVTDSCVGNGQLEHIAESGTQASNIVF